MLSPKQNTSIKVLTLLGASLRETAEVLEISREAVRACLRTNGWRERAEKPKCNETMRELLFSLPFQDLNLPQVVLDEIWIMNTYE